LWGIVPLLTEVSDDVTTTANRIGDELVARHALEPGSVIVFVSVSADLAHGASNFVKLQRV
jgi:hypothetical protein